MDEAIRIEHLYKKFGDVIVLSDINLKCEKGKTYGLIGRNGSGKTVLMKCICGLIAPTSGKIEIEGKILGEQVQRSDNLGILIETPGYLSGFNAYQNLKMLADIRRKISAKEIKQVMIKVGLDPEDKKNVEKFSLGMKQRLGLAQAIMEDPDIILLDEPMNGLDSQGVKDIRQMIRLLHDEGRTLILASHNMEDIHALCDEVFQIEDSILTRKEIVGSSRQLFSSGSE